MSDPYSPPTAPVHHEKQIDPEGRMVHAVMAAISSLFFVLLPYWIMGAKLFRPWPSSFYDEILIAILLSALIAGLAILPFRKLSIARACMIGPALTVLLALLAIVVGH